MKKLFVVVLFIHPIVAFSQGYKIRIGGAAGQEFEIDKIPMGITFQSEIKSIEIKKITADNPKKDYSLRTNDEFPKFSTDGNYQTLTYTKDIRNAGLTVNDETGATVGAPFRLKSGGGLQNIIVDAGISIVMPDEKTATQFLVNNRFKGEILDVPDKGLTIVGGSTKTQFPGPNYIHLFFDQNGNSLLRSIPIGIGRANYVVHIVYLVPKGNPFNIEFKADQATADIEEGAVIRSEGSLQNNLTLQAKEVGQKVVEFEWTTTETALTGSSSDIKFDIVRSGFQINEGNLEVTSPFIVTSKIIKMKRIYHGSIDVGVIKTNLENPAFTLTASDVNVNDMVVKRTNNDSRIMASAMYTFYLSPIVLLEKLFKSSKVQNYKLEGRNFVDDHKIYERIYPTAGITLSDRLLDNVFLGGKWEFIRGGSIFIGYHWGKVNVLNVDETFEFGKTVITQSSFSLKTDTKWKGALCYGLNLDIRIITNLFQRTANTGQ